MPVGSRGVSNYDLQLGDGGDRLTLIVSGVAHQLHAMWVRDACHCDECRRPATNERRFASVDIVPDIVLVRLVIDADSVTIEASDGHPIELPLRWLVEHLHDRDRSMTPVDGHRPWGAGFELTRFGHGDLEDAETRSSWFDALWRDGAVLLTGMPTTRESLEAVATLVGPIRPSNYQRLWSIEATADAVSEVESTHDLLVHTDLPYRDVAPGLQMLLAAVTDVAGGATTLRDGFHVAERLRHDDPEAWRLLTSVEFTYPYIRAAVEHHGRAPLIQLRPDGRYFQIRRAPDLVGVPHVGVDDTPALYAALRRWTELVDDTTEQLEYRLAPGEMLFFHNHRLLHGRTRFDLEAGGRRRMLGCYLDIEDFQSARAVLQRQTT